VGEWGNEYIEQHWITSNCKSFIWNKAERKKYTRRLLEDMSTHNKKAKKQEIEYSESNKSKDLMIVGYRVIVMKHGMKWINYAKVIDINVNEDWAIVKWESTYKNDKVKLSDCKKYEENHAGHRKQKPTEFYMDKPIKKHMKTEKSELKTEKSEPEVQIEIRFYSEDNLSKLCAEGAFRNLMNMLHCSKDKLETFLEMATMSVEETQFALKELLNEKKVPKGVMKGNLDVDSIEILQKKFNFATTSKLKLSCFQCVKHSLKALLEIKFPVVISVQAQRASYNHVVVIWRKMVIDYESKYMYPLTEDSLRQVCGFTTTFQKKNVCMESFHQSTFASHQRMPISKIGVHQNIMNQEALSENISRFRVISLYESCHQSIFPISILAGHRIIGSNHLQQNHNFDIQTDVHKQLPL
jgi:hypothetical protein